MDIIERISNSIDWNNVLINPVILQRLKEQSGNTIAKQVCEYWIKIVATPTLGAMKKNCEERFPRPLLPPMKVADLMHSLEQTLEYVNRFISEI